MKKFLVVLLCIGILFFGLAANCVGPTEPIDPNTNDNTDTNTNGIVLNTFDDIVMFPVTGGTFVMGTNTDLAGKSREGSNRFVTIDDFEMSKCEISYEQWTNVYHWATNNGYEFSMGRMGSYDYDIGTISHHPDEPVTGINFYDVLKWCNALSEMTSKNPVYYTSSDIRSSNTYRTGEIDIRNSWVNWGATGYRLPTEAEWEYTCRAGETGRYFWGGDAIDGDYAWYYTNSGVGGLKSTQKVGTTPLSNDWGFFDMVGNVWEWCWDWYGDYDLYPNNKIILYGASYDSSGHTEGARYMFLTNGFSNYIWALGDRILVSNVYRELGMFEIESKINANGITLKEDLGADYTTNITAIIYSVRKNPKASMYGTYKAIRGGFFDPYNEATDNLRSAARASNVPSIRHFGIGFRIAAKGGGTGNISNVAPVLSSFTASASMFALSTNRLWVTASDRDGDPLEYSYEIKSGTGSLWGSSTSNGMYYLSTNMEGTNEIEVTVSDGNGKFVQSNIFIIVKYTNRAPVISNFTAGGANLSALHTGDTINLSVNAYDSDLDTLTYLYEVVEGLGSLSGANTASNKSYTIGSKPGNNTLRVTVSDVSNYRAEMEMSFTVLNYAPIVGIMETNQTLAPGIPLTLHSVVTDNDAGDVGNHTYMWYVNGSETGYATSNYSFTSIPSEVRAFTNMVKVSDGYDDRYASVIITVYGNFSASSSSVEFIRLPTTTSYDMAGRSTIISNFAISRNEITWAKWYAVKDWAVSPSRTYPYQFSADIVHGTADSNSPVTNLSWYDAVAWCNALSEMEGKESVYYINTNFATTNVYRNATNSANNTIFSSSGIVKWSANGFRLPTEAEWQYAYAGTKDTTYYWGTNDSTNYAYYSANSSAPQVVRQKAANHYGLYDMGGNVDEWCWDWYSATYTSTDTNNPRGPSSGSVRVLRGGNYTSAESALGITNRYTNDAATKSATCGFRIVVQ